MFVAALNLDPMKKWGDILLYFIQRNAVLSAVLGGRTIAPGDSSMSSEMCRTPNMRDTFACISCINGKNVSADDCLLQWLPTVAFVGITTPSQMFELAKTKQKVVPSLSHFTASSFYANKC